MRNIYCFIWGGGKSTLEIPEAGDCEVTIFDELIRIPPIHEKNKKILVYFQGNVPEDGLGKNVNILYKSQRLIPVDTNICIERYKHCSTLPLDIYLCAFSTNERAIYCDYRSRSFYRRYVSLEFPGDVPEIRTVTTP